MSMQEAAKNARAAVNSLHAVSAICADLAPLNISLTEQQARQRAALIRSVLRARQRMQLLRARAEALSNALVRCPSRHDAINGSKAG
jgi:hypothetical protein